MLDDFHNSGPGHEADLVSYMYGEMDGMARERFESHLSTCDSCAFELGGYADARLGVIEWRRNDFDHLATPAIIIPDSQPARALVAERPKSIWAGWLETIYTLPRLAQAGMGLAAAALLIGIFYLGFMPGRPIAGSETLAGKNQTTSPAPQERVIAPAPINMDQASNQPKGPFKPSPVEVKERQSGVGRSNVRPQRAIMHQTPVMRNYRKLGSLEAVTLTPKTQAAPTLNTFDEEEDTTLRLSDLFSQVSPRKK